MALIQERFDFRAHKRVAFGRPVVSPRRECVGIAQIDIRNVRPVVATVKYGL